MADGFNKLPPGMKKFIGYTLAITAGLLLLIGIIGTVVTSIMSFAALFATGGALAFAAPAVGVIGAALLALVSPLGIVSIAVIALAANWKGVAKDTKEAIKYMKNYITTGSLSGADLKTSAIKGMQWNNKLGKYVSENNVPIKKSQEVNVKTEHEQTIIIKDSKGNIIDKKQPKTGSNMGHTKK
jgi:hypothetical protein